MSKKEGWTRLATNAVLDGAAIGLLIMTVYEFIATKSLRQAAAYAILELYPLAGRWAVSRPNNPVTGEPWQD